MWEIHPSLLGLVSILDQPMPGYSLLSVIQKSANLEVLTSTSTQETPQPS